MKAVVGGGARHRVETPHIAVSVLPTRTPPVVVSDTRTDIADLLLDRARERVTRPHVDGRLGVNRG